MKTMRTMKAYKLIRRVPPGSQLRGLYKQYPYSELHSDARPDPALNTHVWPAGVEPRVGSRGFHAYTSLEMALRGAAYYSFVNDLFEVELSGDIDRSEWGDCTAAASHIRWVRPVAKWRIEKVLKRFSCYDRGLARKNLNMPAKLKIAKESA